MRASEENGITNEAIVLQWLVWSTLWETSRLWTRWGLCWQSRHIPSFLDQFVIWISAWAVYYNIYRFWPSGYFLVGTFTILFHTTGCDVHHENTQRWMVYWYKGL